MLKIVTPALQELHQAFRRHNRDIRLVGGAVRALLLDEQPADIDLCTDADPDEQQAVYETADIKHFPTGIKHGTWTVVLSDRTVVEITSLRTETDHDGRHATVQWTRDWHEDLSRRDLTINAIAMAFDGTLIDPFNGQADLMQGIVRFVGDPTQRIHEDYLRILRFFRFHARIAGDRPYDAPTLVAIMDHMAGLIGIARERVWSEIAKVLVGRYGVLTLNNMIDHGIAPFIDLPVKDTAWLRPDEFQAVRDPAALMAAYLGTREAVQAQATVWRWSTEERERASFIAEILANRPLFALAEAQELAARGAVKQWMAEALRLLGKSDDAEILLRWQTPHFPVFGRDLLAAGLTESEEIGRLLRDLRKVWEESGYQLDRHALLALLPTVRIA